MLNIRIFLLQCKKARFRVDSVRHFLQNLFIRSRGAIAYAELACAAFLFLSLLLWDISSYFSKSIVAISFLYSVVFTFFILFYLIYRDSRKDRLFSIGCHIYFAALILLYFSLFAYSPSILTIFFLLTALKGISYYLVYALLSALILFLSYMGLYLIKQGHALYGSIAIVALLAVLLTFYVSHLAFSGYTNPDDEVLLSYTAIKGIQHGINPYNSSISGLLYASDSVNTTNTSITITTTNRIVGTMDYPDLYFLSSAPFYLWAENIMELRNVYMPLQSAALTFLLLLVLAYFIQADRSASFPKFSVALLLFITIMLVNVASLTTYLMLAVILFAYAKIESKYAFLLLGVACSIQEELWLPAVFLIAYSANNLGIKRGTYNAIGAALVFLALNSYFILLNPVAFFRAVFLPLSSPLMPNGAAMIGYFLVHNYPILLNTFSKLFMLTSLILLLLLLYTNKKELIFAASFIPFLFLSHSNPVYYYSFIFLFIASLQTVRKEGKGIFEIFLKRNYALSYALFIALISLMLYLVFSSHASYLRGFSVSVSNQSLKTQNGTTLYDARISYQNLSNSTVYLAIVGMSNYSTGIYGLLNQSITANPVNCAVQYPCGVNLNRIVLSGRGVYDLHAIITPALSPVPVNPASLILYNGINYYAAWGTYNKSAG